MGGIIPFVLNRLVCPKRFAKLLATDIRDITDKSSSATITFPERVQQGRIPLVRRFKSITAESTQNRVLGACRVNRNNKKKVGQLKCKCLCKRPPSCGRYTYGEP